MPESIGPLVELFPQAVLAKAYDDFASPIMRQLGETGEDVIKAARLLLFPIQYLAAKQDRLEIFFKKIAEKVPEERRIPAPASIAGPVFEKLKFLEPESPLTELYLNLLARAIDKERSNEAHPAFIQIISQLSPDEAMFMYLLKDSKFKFVEYLDYDRTINKFLNHRWIVDPFPYENLTYPQNFHIYRLRLESLTLITWPVIDQKPVHTEGVQTGLNKTSELQTTAFGDLFIKACIPESFNINLRSTSL